MTRLAAPIVIAVTWACFAEDPYRWPLDLPRQLTSSFAEYRSGRFHAGIDLRTGPIGQLVYAAGDGYVERIRSSPYGYGNAIYLRLDDGNSIVYGHLDSFEEPLAGYVRASQHARESITVDLYPEASMFRITRGQLIARSGNTGIGHPHLHYEFRDPSGRPINPRLLGVTWTDTGRPTPQKVFVTPEGPGSWVQGDMEPVVLDLRETAPGKYTTDRVRVWGRVGVGVDVIDPAHGSKLGVWRIETALDGQETFRIQHDVFSYGDTHNAAVVYHPFLADRGRFLVQWRWLGNATPIYQHSSQDGWIEVPEGEHAITLRILDFYENEGTVTIPVLGEAPAVHVPVDANTAMGTVDVACWGNYLTLAATFPAAEAEAPVLLVDGLMEADAFHAVSDTVWRAAFRATRGADDWSLQVQHPRLEPYQKNLAVAIRGEPRRTVRMGGMEIATAPDSPYGALYLTVDPVSVSGRLPVTPLTQACTLGFARSPIDAPVHVTFDVPLDGVRPERVDVYRVSGNRASAMGAERNGSRFHVSTRALGTFVALEDAETPEIGGFSAKPGTLAARPQIVATVKDALSGVEDIRLTFNGRWLLVRYDPEHDHVRWEQDHDLPSGAGDATLTVRDAAGNVAERTVTVNIP